jgi:O-antigen/teichoic acid export membrane protein
VEGFGQYGFTLAIIGFFTVISEFGLNPVQIRETSINRDSDLPRRYISLTLLARTILGCISLAIIVAVAIFANKPDDVRLLLILLGAGMFVTNLFGSYSAVLMGLEKLESFAVFSALYSLGFTVLAIAALKLGFGLVGIGVSQLSVGLIITVAGVLYVTHKVMKPLGGIDFPKGIEIFKMAAPLGLTAVLTAIYYRANFIILSYMRGDMEVGYLNAAYTISNTLLLFATTFSGSLLPRLSSLFVNDYETLGKIYRTAFKYLVFVGIGSAFGAVALAKPVIEFLFGEQFMPGATALSILIWGSALMFANSLQGNMLVASNKKRELVHMTGVAAAANIALNFLLIPPYGIGGAALAMVVSEAITGIWSFVLLRRHNPPSTLLAIIVKSVLASLLMILAIISIPMFHVAYRVIIGIAAYAVGLVVFRGFDAADIKIIRNLAGVGASR